MTNRHYRIIYGLTERGPTFGGVDIEARLEYSNLKARRPSKNKWYFRDVAHRKLDTVDNTELQIILHEMSSELMRRLQETQDEAEKEQLVADVLVAANGITLHDHPGKSVYSPFDY